MVDIIDINNITIRTFGWVQDPSDFNSLRKVVEIFNYNSKTHKELVNIKIKKLVKKRDGQDKLINSLKQRPLKIKYIDLVGTPFKPRNSARCNGIVQATVKGQRRQFISDWPADNFVRWAHALGFIKYNYDSDTFEITQLGLDYTESDEDSREELEILERAMLSYPPVTRVLSLLSNGDHLTKYDIGKQLGFVGEDGFTSLPLNILIMTLSNTDEPSEKNKIKTDWDGSSDKYARMICNWIKKLNWVLQRPKNVTVHLGETSYTETIGHAYMITADGLKALRKSLGINKVSRINKNVFWEMFCTKGIDKNYIRTRRAYILKFLIESSKSLTLNDLKEKLLDVGINENTETIKDDVDGIINIGINIKCESKGYKLYDSINNFVIPRFNISETKKSDISNIKDELRTKLKSIPHEYLTLVDISFDSKQNRLFEMKTMEVLINEYGFSGTHLGGSRKPDGVIYTTNLENNYGVIVDTKAYSKGYNLPINQADEMERYIRENITRDEKINPNKWWLKFNSKVNNYYFLFISSMFKGRYEEQLKRISMNTGINGAALNVINLLLGANMIKEGKTSLDKLEKEMFLNKEYKF
ncbi:restriction endonuclease FokI C-terminal domain-containing protein [Clostridium sporogenes]|uniref:restriction endonuclease FokI C-terminal domain-containing protein n=1 Tax=Clostridium sporogenes TaxID=1509 RepID=UPI00313A9603